MQHHPPAHRMAEDKKSAARLEDEGEGEGEGEGEFKGGIQKSIPEAVLMVEMRENSLVQWAVFWMQKIQSRAQP